MVQCIEILGQVYRYRIPVSFFRVFLHLLNRLLTAPFRSVSVAAVRKLRFPYVLQLLCDSLLYHSVYYRRDSQFSHATIWFRDFLSPHRAWLVASVSDTLQKFLPMFLQPRQRFFYAHSVDSCCSVVALDPLIRSVQVIPVQYRFQQVTCTVSFFPFAAACAPRFCIPLVFHTFSLQEALVSSVFCFHHTDLLPVFT